MVRDVSCSVHTVLSASSAGENKSACELGPCFHFGRGEEREKLLDRPKCRSP